MIEQFKLLEGGQKIIIRPSVSCLPVSALPPSLLPSIAEKTPMILEIRMKHEGRTHT